MAINLPAYRPELKGAVEKFFDLVQGNYKKHLKGKGVIEPDYQERGAHDYRKDVIESDLLAFEFAKYMAAVFDTSIDFRNEVPLSSVLYHALAKTKYMKSSGKSRYTKMLAEDIKEYYQKIGLPNIPSIYQVQRTLLESRFDFSVVCQIAFFIGMSVEELTKPILTDEQIEHEQSSHYIKNSTPIFLNQSR